MSLQVFQDVLTRRLRMTSGNSTGPPGVQVVVVSSSDTVFEGSSGLADPLVASKCRELLSTGHQANLYSVTKFFTACCILKLVDQGKLSLSTKARDVLPDSLKAFVNDCTIQQLVMHTALAPNPLPLSWVHREGETVDEEALLLRVLEKNPFPAITSSSPSYQYSNVGYWILGAVIAHVSNKPMPAYSEICDELLFQENLPKDTRKVLGTTFLRGFPTAAGYVSTWSFLAVAARFFVPKWILGTSNRSWTRMNLHCLDGASFGGLISTSQAVASFLQCILKGNVLSPESMKLLFSPQISQMTMGLHVRSHRGMPVYHKEGGGAGCHSSIHFRPYQDLAACVIAGDAEFDVNGLLDEILDCAADATAAAAMIMSRTKYVNVSDGCVLRTKCYESIKDTRPVSVLLEPVLLIHGGPGVPDYLEPLAHLFLQNDLATTVISFDQRGVGKSREALTNDLSMNLMVSDIDYIRDAYEAKRIHVVGHSWGGVLAQLYAMSHPQSVSSLVLLSPSTVSDASQWAAMEKQVLMSNLDKCGWYKFTKMGIYSLLMLFPGIADYAARKLFQIIMKNYYFDPRTAPDPPPSFLAGVSSKACFATKRAFVRDVITPMNAPTTTRSLAVFGDNDIYGTDMTKQFLQRFVANKIIDHAGHITWLDQPRELTRTLKEFYAKGTKQMV